ncbi:MAG TPA: GntR family transcriptional regulator [Thermoanaerobaculia bacterium]|nr:GntR family transcriptional regulator [Thermoanaerobaculia bacterium]
MIQIDLDSPRPLEEQIASGLRLALASGTVRPGDELPPIRQLAGDLGVHWNTVARAYRRLGEEGLLRVQHGRSAVAIDREHLPSRKVKAGLRERFVEAIGGAVLGGLSPGDIDKVFKEALAGFDERKRT